MWCVQNGVQRLDGKAFGQVGLGRRSPSLWSRSAFVSAWGERKWSTLGLRTVVAARPTDLEAGNVDWLDLRKRDGGAGEEGALEGIDDEQRAGPQGSAILALPAQSDADQLRREQQFASILQVCVFVVNYIPHSCVLDSHWLSMQRRSFAYLHNRAFFRYLCLSSIFLYFFLPLSILAGNRCNADPLSDD